MVFCQIPPSELIECEISREFRTRPVFNMAGSKLVLEGRISITSFLLGLGVIIIPLFVQYGSHVDWIFDYLTGTNGKIAIALYITVINGFLLIIYKGPLYKVREKLNRLSVVFTLSLFGSLSSQHIVSVWNGCVL